MQNGLISRLGLGTVQFGQIYGVANQRGKIPKQEAFEILKHAQITGLKTLDTSVAYGNSENIIGELTSEGQFSFEVISKILVGSDRFSKDHMDRALHDSLHRLRNSQLYGCLIHRFDDFLKHDHLWEILEGFKKNGFVKKTGFSLYHPHELELILDRGISPDIIQVPLSVFDRRFEKSFKMLKEGRTEIHVRSVFLQGLVFLTPDRLKGNLCKAKTQLEKLQKLSAAKGISINALCLNYVLLNPFINKVIMGCDSLEHFKKNIEDLEFFEKVSCLKSELEDLTIEDEDVLLPYKWN